MKKKSNWKMLKGYADQCYKQKLALKKAGFRVREMGAVDHVHVDDWEHAIKYIKENKLPGYERYKNPDVIV